MPKAHKEWLFKPLDTLFFRDGKPFGFGESAYLESIFPPTPQTMQGVVRSAILLSHCKDPKLFGSGKCDTCRDEKNCHLSQNIGSPKEGDYGSLDIYGPYLVDGKRYYPIPLDLMQEAEGQKRLVSLKPKKKAVDQCDIGSIPLPAKPDGYDAIKEVKGWIEGDALFKYLRDQNQTMPDKNSLKQDSDFFGKEPRVGIGRDYAKHTTKDGMLYSIAPLRFKKDISIGIRVDGIDESLQPKHNSSTKFGGEGRACELEIKDYSDTQQPFTFKSDDKYIRMMLLQPADFGGWLPPGFKATTHNGSTCWAGNINGVKLHLVSACIGKPQKIGGWDVVKKTVKPMRSYVPAGSVYFFEIMSGDPPTLPVEGKIGNNTAIGFGHYILGRWSDV